MTAISTRWAKSFWRACHWRSSRWIPRTAFWEFISNAPGKGLKTTYSALIQQAFLPEWWQFSRHICTAADGSTVTNVDPADV